jgi:hypothetical protein
MGYFSDPIGRVYDTLLPEDAKASLKELKRYFGDGRNKLGRARNCFAFHYNVEATERQLKTIPDDLNVDLYFGHHAVHSFYQVSEAALQNALARELNPENPKQGTDELMEEAAAVGRHFLRFIGGFTHALLDRHFGPSRAGLQDEIIDISDVAIEGSSVDIPYFVKNPR